MTHIFTEEVPGVGGKTKVWAVRSKHGDKPVLGYVEWYAPWRKYCLFPLPSTVFEEVCMRELSDFIVNENAAAPGAGQGVGGRTMTTPAFPAFVGTSGHGMCKPGPHGDWENYDEGMSLRDYFAACMAPFAAQMQMLNVQQLEAAGLLKGMSEEDGKKAMMQGMARLAYDFADAMLNERSIKKGTE